MYIQSLGRFYPDAVGEKINALAHTDVPVLITGEFGAGKTAAAEVVHCTGKYCEQILTVLDCATLTNVAAGERIVDSTDGGTLFFDNIHQLREEMRRMLSLLFQSNSRVIAATAPGPLETEIQSILNGVYLELPPLRRLNVVQFDELLDCLQKRNINPAARQFLREQPWHGNFHALHGVLRRANKYARGDELTLKDIWNAMGIDSEPAAEPNEFDSIVRTFESHLLTGQPLKLEEIEAEVLRRALKITGDNRSKAAALLGLSRHQLRYRLESAATPAESNGAADVLNAFESALRAGETVKLEDVERAVLERALRITRGNMTRAGELLGVTRHQVNYGMKKFGLEKPR